jgi:predicted dehydrogenase
MLSAMKGEIDLVSICTPPYTHAEISVNCLKAGCHVVLEKPMASSLEECDAIIRAEKESGKVVSCIAQNRFRDPIMALKKVLEKNMIGRVLHAQVDSFWWRGKWETEGGGCTLNHAVHHIDMLIWMMGLPEKVTAVISNAAHDNAEVEDVSVAVLQYPKGSLAQITSSVIHHGDADEQQLIFQGEKARVSAPWRVCANKAAENAFPMKEHDVEIEKSLNDFVNSLPPLEHTAHKGQIDDVLSALEKKSAPVIGSHDGRSTIELITAIYKSGTVGHAVTLPIAKDDPFYTAKGILASVPRFYEKKSFEKDLAGAINTGADYKK